MENQLPLQFKQLYICGFRIPQIFRIAILKNIFWKQKIAVLHRQVHSLCARDHLCFLCKHFIHIFVVCLKRVSYLQLSGHFSFVSICSSCEDHPNQHWFACAHRALFLQSLRDIRDLALQSNRSRECCPPAIPSGRDRPGLGIACPQSLAVTKNACYLERGMLP